MSEINTNQNSEPFAYSLLAALKDTERFPPVLQRREDLLTIFLELFDEADDWNPDFVEDIETMIMNGCQVGTSSKYAADLERLKHDLNAIAADYDQWFCYPTWTAEEACSLSLGYDPDFAKGILPPNSSAYTKFANNSRKRQQIIQKAAAAQTLATPISPTGFMRWRETIPLVVPKRMDETFSKQTIARASPNGKKSTAKQGRPPNHKAWAKFEPEFEATIAKHPHDGSMRNIIRITFERMSKKGVWMKSGLKPPSESSAEKRLRESYAEHFAKARAKARAK